MYYNYEINNIFNPRDKLSERKEELINQRNEIKKQFETQTKEIKRQMQIYQTLSWKQKNPQALAAQKHRRYLWLKETKRLRNILA